MTALEREAMNPRAQTKTSQDAAADAASSTMSGARTWCGSASSQAANQQSVAASSGSRDGRYTESLAPSTEPSSVRPEVTQAKQAAKKIIDTSDAQATARSGAW